MDEDPLPDHLRCNRSDGRQWRCKRRVKENMKLCEIHYLQGRHRQFKEKVPESLKLQRMRKKKALGNNNNNRDQSVKIRVKKVENLAKLMKRKKKMKNFKRGADTQLELIRMVLKREVEKRKSNKKTKKKKKDEVVVVEENSEGQLMRYLPNGLMAISSSPSPSPRQHSGNAGSESPCRVKVGVDFGAVRYRQFRSKNIEPMPIGTLQVTPCAFILLSSSAGFSVLFIIILFYTICL